MSYRLETTQLHHFQRKYEIPYLSFGIFMLANPDTYFKKKLFSWKISEINTHGKLSCQTYEKYHKRFLRSVLGMSILATWIFLI